jgi:hypothetical protein
MPNTDPNPRAVAGANNPPDLATVLKEKHQAIFDRLKAWKAKAKAADKIVPITLEDCAKLDKIFADGRDIANDADAIRKKEKQPSLDEGNVIDAVFNVGVRDEVGAGQGKEAGLARSLADKAATKKLELTRAAQRKLDEEADKVAAAAERLAEKAQSQADAGRGKVADTTQRQAEALEEHAQQLAVQAAAPVQEASKTRIGGITSSVKAELVCTGVIRAELDLEALRPYFKQEHLELAVQTALKMGAFKELKGAAIIEKAKGSVRR